MQNFLDRLLLIIEEQEGGKHTVFARKAGVHPGTFQNYVNGKRKPNYEALLSICETFNINLNWLLTGKGPKYITDQGDGQVLDPDPEIAELMEGARRVLTSGNPIAFDALERNIRYFDHAIAAEKELQEMKEDVAEIKRELARLKKDKTDPENPPKEEPSPDEKAA